MAKKLGMFSATHESVTAPVGRDRKIRTAVRTNHIAGFVTVPFEKEIKDNVYKKAYAVFSFYFFPPKSFLTNLFTDQTDIS